MNYLICSLSGLPTQDALFDPVSGRVFDRDVIRSLNDTRKKELFGTANVNELRPLELNLQGQSKMSSLEILEHEINLLEAQKSELSEQNERLAAELAHVLLKDKVLQEEQDVIFDLVKTSQIGESAEPFKANSHKKFGETLKTLYKAKIEENRQEKSELKAIDFENGSHGQAQRCIIDFEPLQALITPKMRFICIIDSETTLRVIDCQTSYLLKSIKLPGQPSAFDCIEAGHAISAFLMIGSILTRIDYNYTNDLLKKSSFALDLQNENFLLFKVHPSAKFVIIGLSTELRFYDASTGRLDHHMQLPVQSERIAMHPDGKLVALVAQTANSKLQLLDLIEFKIVATFETGLTQIQRVTFSKDRFHFGVSDHNSTEIVDLRSRKVVKKLPGLNVSKHAFVGEQFATAILQEGLLQIEQLSDKSANLSIDLQASKDTPIELLSTSSAVWLVCKESLIKSEI